MFLLQEAIISEFVEAAILRSGNLAIIFGIHKQPEELSKALFAGGYEIERLVALSPLPAHYLHDVYGLSRFFFLSFAAS